jgi:di/tricarboxylate transporter
VDWSILIVIAASFGIGSALLITGAAQTVATSIIDLSSGNPGMTLALMFLVTSLLSAFATNNAAAVIMFPVALSTASGLQVSALPFIIALMVAASASFATPIGYQTNLMVFGPGGYRFSDFMRIGLPLTLLVGLLTVILAPLIWPF